MVFACTAFCCLGLVYCSVTLANELTPGDGFQSWVERRDAGVVKQRLDYSCGIAALATLLRLQSIASPSEAQLIDRFAAQFDSTDTAAIQRRLQAGYSLADLSALAATYGAKPIALRLTAAQLRGIKIPIIARLQLQSGAHFTVLSEPVGSSASVVSLADPSWGNRRMLIHQFLDLWLDTGDEPNVRPTQPTTFSASTRDENRSLQQMPPETATGLVFALIPAMT